MELCSEGLAGGQEPICDEPSTQGRGPRRAERLPACLLACHHCGPQKSLSRAQEEAKKASSSTCVHLSRAHCTIVHAAQRWGCLRQQEPGSSPAGQDKKGRNSGWSSGSDQLSHEMTQRLPERGTWTIAALIEGSLTLQPSGERRTSTLASPTRNLQLRGARPPAQGRLAGRGQGEVGFKPGKRIPELPGACPQGQFSTTFLI